MGSEMCIRDSNRYAASELVVCCRITSGQYSCFYPIRSIKFKDIRTTSVSSSFFIVIQEIQKILAGDAETRDFFGGSVSIDGDRAIIGAFGNDDFTGSAYIFEFDGTSWIETAILTASDAAANDNFGGSVSIDGDRAIIGAIFGDDDNIANTGSCLLYTSPSPRDLSTSRMPSSA